ncbi:THUMP domain-containing class I SAM-dependent RNA methyltransferase [Desulfosoma sp.]|uniref:THUMP domain-containing class I SAM-dependent RNA methyltransferase n=1 Tax=Desulfosoma sp. TaxID=2603217 RepID=UPI00404AF7CA
MMPVPQLRQNVSSMERRVRTHVRAKMHRFAAIVPQELVSVCRREMERLGLDILEESEAGIEFQGKLEACYRANLWLRTASRIVCRWFSIKVGAREELFARVVRLPWELWIDAGVPVRVDVYLKGARITHSGLAQKAFQDALRQRFETLGRMVRFLEGSHGGGKTEEDTSIQGEGFVQRILLHVQHKQGVISLDTSGAHLHRRGYRIQHAGAPIRETLAAALLLQSGWTPQMPLIDGMSGSGTAVIEAALLAANIPPGRRRQFLFEKWPSFQEKTWAYLLNRADAGRKALQPGTLIGVDRDAKAVVVAQENARRAGVAEWVTWHAMPFENVDPQKWSIPPGLVFLNPPYGVRLEVDRSLYERVGRHLECCFRGWKAIVLAPHRELLIFDAVRPRKIRRLRHGGLSICAGFYDL